MSVPVSSEGLAERLGDILLSCSQGTPGELITGNLTVFLPIKVTNRITTGNITDAVISVDTGTGPGPGVAGRLATANTVAFDGLSFTVPATGHLDLRISNLRGDVNELGLTPQQPISAQLSFGPRTIPIADNAMVTVGVTERALLATVAGSTVRCTGSPLPKTITVTNLFAAGSRYATTRVTEGSANAFQKKDAFSGTGMRIMLLYAGFPDGARLFVPDAVAGSSAIVQTAAGDLGVPKSGGQYAAGLGGSLLLVRVLNPNADGSGGTFAYTYPGTGVVTLDGASEVPLSGGTGSAVYEAVDANASLRESAQIPTFLGISPASIKNDALASVDVSLAPVSTVDVASTTAPVPRFVQLEAPPDCTALSDCSAAYFPRLMVDAPDLTYSAPVGAFLQTKYVRIHNTAGGSLNWTATINIPDGPQWLTVDPASGINDATIRIDAHPERVPPGTYTGTVAIDAGPLVGSRVLPVTFTVGPLFAQITAVTNAATFQKGPLVAGSLATLFGKGFGNSSVVTFDNQPAKLLYTSDTQINLQVPETLAGKTTSQIAVIVDGTPGLPQAVTLATVAPGIFGILNQDNSLNTATTGAALGSTVQVFATGLISASSGPVTARIGSREIPSPAYAGPSGFGGVQQVNVVIPTDLPAADTNLAVCAVAPPSNQPVCSPPVALAIQQ